MNFDSIMFCIGYSKACGKETQVREKGEKKRRRKRPNCSKIRFVCFLCFFVFYLFFLYCLLIFFYLDLGFLPADRIGERHNDGAGKQ
jgi:hypothetical protein